MQHCKTRSAWLMALAIAAPVALAENIDPEADGSRFAYGENIGWLNAAPAVAGRPGVQVDDFELTGFAWGENIGWISLNCRNTDNCATRPYAVVNDGAGTLSGFAWAENAGWIDFAPATAGVTIDPTTGEFDGRAWAENVGWISFAGHGPRPYALRTGWSCDPAPPAPSDPVDLRLERSGNATLLSWSAVRGSTGFDVVQGALAALLDGGGDYAAATTGCAADNRTTSSLTVADAPAAGEAIWFVVGPANCGGRGAYDSGQPGQAAPRDAGIAGSGNDCS